MRPVPLAHSPRPAHGIPAQPYADHVMEVVLGSLERARAVAMFSEKLGGSVVAANRFASEYHDLGKLDNLNQKILGSISGARLPISHEDAGVLHLLKSKPASFESQLGALLIYSHHAGLPSLPEERIRTTNCLRSKRDGPGGALIQEITDAKIQDYELVHSQNVTTFPTLSLSNSKPETTPLGTRVALSCLIDADHSDTARHYRQHPSWDAPRPSVATRLSNLDMPIEALRETQAVSARWAERLASLDAYVAKLANGKNDARTRLRQKVYQACRSADPSDPLRECDSPVGTGKTTAVMAHLLQAALAKNLRRIFVVLPFTNIIDQSVEIYRKCLVRPGENPESIVAAVHHRSEYQNLDSRYLSALWSAPIIVTTAVQFFETLAACSTRSLRKLHTLPGSAVFVDESHAALPPKLWPRAWNWIEQLADAWGCHFVLGSGSLNRIWTIPQIKSSRKALSPIVAEATVKTEADEAERKRLQPRTKLGRLTLDEFVKWLADWKMLPGPRLVIVNTVQIAAELARQLAETDGPSRVMHLSTSLTPHHRAITLDRVKSRLSYRTDDDWTLVATSCVEAGVDLSFRTGLRQRASLVSLLQTAGRVNRNEEFRDAAIWDFDLVQGGLININPSCQESAQILQTLFRENKVAPEFCTEALLREILARLTSELNKRLEDAESSQDFPDVEKRFRIIDTETSTAVVSKFLRSRIEAGGKVDWREIQRHSVQIYSNRLEKLRLPEAMACPGVFFWNLPYDDFLGYMAGVLPLLRGEQDGGFII